MKKPVAYNQEWTDTKSLRIIIDMVGDKKANTGLLAILKSKNKLTNVGDEIMNMIQAFREAYFTFTVRQYFQGRLLIVRGIHMVRRLSGEEHL